MKAFTQELIGATFTALTVVAIANIVAYLMFGMSEGLSWWANVVGAVGTVLTVQECDKKRALKKQLNETKEEAK